MINCHLCKNNYYSDKNPDTICEGKCKKRETREYKNEMLLEDLQKGICRFFDEHTKE